MPAMRKNAFSLSAQTARAALRCSVAALLAASGVAAAQESLTDLSDQWVHNALAQSEMQQTMPLRMEPYLPSGSKLWGRTRIGVRCVEGDRPWNVFVPVTVKAFGPAWVLTQNVNMGEPLTMNHAMQSEVDWAESPHAIIALPDDWVGKTAVRNLTAGMALRQTMVKAPELFKAGAGVKVLVQGAGFQVTSSGKALQGGSVGESVRVRMDNGRTVIGTVNAQGEVLVAQ